MSIIRYTASADNTITNAFEVGLVNRGTGSNMGYADALEVFSIYGQLSSSTMGQSQELSRILIDFDVPTLIADRAAGTLAASGSVSWYLRMHNARTPFTLPQGFNLVVAPISRSWSEGTGLDMDEYQDSGASNWLSSSTGSPWDTVGGDYMTASNYTVNFPLGYEDVNLDVSHLVEKWISGADTAYTVRSGVGIRLISTEEAYYSGSSGLTTGAAGPLSTSGSLIHNPNGATESFYTKKFFSRSTEFFFKRPVLEARWNNALFDDRENFYYSSSNAPAVDNLNTLKFYNYIRGRAIDPPAVSADGQEMDVSFYSSSNSAPAGSKLNLAKGGAVVADLDVNATGTLLSTGIYTCNIALTAATTPLTAIHDVWHWKGVEYFTGSFYPEKFPTYDSSPTFARVTSCKNLKDAYSNTTTSRFRFFVRSKDWSPTVYTVATANNPTEIIPSASYNVRRVIDNYDAIPYGTGSDLCTLLSYDKGGNYFDLDMGLLESGYMYKIKLSYYNDSIGSWQEQPQTFKFRVDE